LHHRGYRYAGSYDLRDDVVINCGRFKQFHSDKMNSSWLKQLFEPKDDQAWLQVLLEKKEISSEQFEWLKSLFSKKAEADKDNSADKWWKNISNSNLETSFDPSVVPDWIKEHKHDASWIKEHKQDHDFNWSMKWEGKDTDKDALADRLEEAKKNAQSELEDAKAKHFKNLRQKFGDAADLQ
jgi:hypothetical protein